MLATVEGEEEEATKVDEKDKETILDEDDDKWETKVIDLSFSHFKMPSKVKRMNYFQTISFPSFEEALNVDWLTKKLIRYYYRSNGIVLSFRNYSISIVTVPDCRKARGLLPSSYFPIRGILFILPFLANIEFIECNIF